jgi:acyl-CoA synthetase (AMP-forming)/AMP-acid ligase II
MLGAVPSIFPFLTEKLDPDHYFKSVQQLIQRSGVRAVITYAELKPQLDNLLQGIEGLLPLLLTDDLTLGGDLNEFLSAYPTDPQRTAFLQHSSGSTGLQKGVMLSHQSVINQIASYSEAIQLAPDDVICSWLPLYHDMGLIAGFIMPIMQGIPLVLMSPFHWIRSPHILLDAMHRHRGTLCWLPNFAYNFLATRVRDAAIQHLNLSHVKAFINCSEPVRAESHSAFLERYQPFGVKETMLTVSYAMAENTFAVTQTDLHTYARVDRIDRATLLEQQQAILTESENALLMVSCGKPIRGVEIKVTRTIEQNGQKNEQVLPERHVGEIALRGDSMLTGYYHQPDVTAEVMREGWYYTGDMGYIADGEVYITGRMKDLIIVGGKNIYPQDIELIVSNIEGVKDGRTVAFGVFNEKLGTEDIVVIAEVLTPDEETHYRIQREARQRIVQATDVNARYVYLVDEKWLHKTSSGKIARRANKEKFLQEVHLREG